MSRKPISVVKESFLGLITKTSRLHRNCSGMIQPVNDTHSLNDTTWCNWAPFDQSNYKELLGAVDNAFLVAYAVGMFISGIFGERLPLRYYLTAGMLLSGLFTSLLGLGYFWNIHTLWYFVRAFALHSGLCSRHRKMVEAAGPTQLPQVPAHPALCSFITMRGPIAHDPEDVGCSPPQHHGGLEENVDDAEDPGSGPHSNRENGLESAVTSSKEPSAQPAAISFFGALWIPGVVEFSLCLLFAKLVSYTFLYWLPLYIFNVVHFSAKESGDLSTLFDVGGIMFLYNYVGQSGISISIVMLLICGALVNGPYALITTAVSADLGTHKSLKGNAKALSTVTAIIDGTGSIGAALGPLLAGLISPTGWNNVFYMLITADILACLLLCRLVYKEILAWKASLSRDRG
ncbi:hypothetical protein E2I00_007165 [Balaenoptera physalus]|uniref:Major facilitator superfamily (MFS) profile domain-containing protein n=1 Tax=Balaenoptera physalus TaxID=9770 RepID=A0A643BSC0_BALPH|nr:hypothetical protein E2I00_007165 [Balaenoptera physalus]